MLCSGLIMHSYFDISRGVFHCRLKIFIFLEVFPSTDIYPLLRLIFWNLTTQCLAVTGGGSVGECGRLNQLQLTCRPMSMPANNSKCNGSVEEYLTECERAMMAHR